QAVPAVQPDPPGPSVRSAGRVRAPLGARAGRRGGWCRPRAVAAARRPAARLSLADRRRQALGSPARAGVLTRWSVGQDRTVSPADRGPDGGVTPHALGGWVDAAVQAYLDQCGSLQRQAVDGGLTV